MEPIIINFKEPEKNDRRNIIQMKTRILRPAEYEKLRSNCDKPHQTFFDGLLLSGMKLDEYRYFLKNPSLFDGKLIELPEIRSKKRIIVRQRSVKLSLKGRAIIKNIHRSLDANSMPENQSYIKYLKRIAIKANMDTEGLNLKCFRKTWESWLIASYPYRIGEVLLSQGRTTISTLKDYNNLSFGRDDLLEMKEWVEDW